MTGSNSITLLDNGADTVIVTANGAFTFATTLPTGASYAATFQASATGETCAITGASGQVGSSAITSIMVACTPIVAAWTFENGAETGNATGLYGSMGVPSAGSTPGAREQPATWTDHAGNLWMFGGATNPSVSGGTEVYFGDLWQYSVTTHEWTWVSGSSLTDATGVYGSLGVASAANSPGARTAAQTWTDASGNFWLYGGAGYDASGSYGLLGDLWSFTVSTNSWTWVGGSSAVLPHPVYGTLGISTASSTPGGRTSALTWVDQTGSFWMFGGSGFDSTGAHGNTNELWRYSPTSLEWTWMGGSDVVNGASNYGTMGQAAATNVPGARIRSVSWTDASGNLWLFGGQFVNQSTAPPTGLVYDDLWKYSVSSGLWTWVGGSQTANGGTYGTLGVASASNDPGPRFSAYAAVDSAGNFRLFGGIGSGPSTSGSTPPPTGGLMNDLWVYSPSTGQWTWIAGTSAPGAVPTYGTQGQSAGSNVPGGRAYGGAWSDAAGAFWIFGGSANDAATSQPSDDNQLWEFQP